MSGELKPVDEWDFHTSETKYVLHSNLRALIDEANKSKVPFRLFRKVSPRQGFIETVVLNDVVFQSDGERIRQGVWDERKLVITGEGVFTLTGEEAE